MALCISVANGSTGNPPAIFSGSGPGVVVVGRTNVFSVADNAVTQVPWVVGEATRTGDQYACPIGAHVLLTVEEANAKAEFTLDLESLGITPETVLFVGSAGFAVVLGAFLLGWGVGICKDLIKRIT